MSDYTQNEIIDIIMILGECHGNYHAAARLYCVRFPDRHQRPADIMIARIERHERRWPHILRQRRHVMVIETERSTSSCCVSYCEFKSPYIASTN